MLSELKHIAYSVALAFIVGVCVWGYVELHRSHPDGVGALVASPAPETRIDRLEREVQAVVETDRVLASSRGAVPALAQPAVAVLHDVAPGFTGAQIAQILGGMRAPTREVIAATSHLIGPRPTSSPTAPPGWSQAQLDSVYAAARKADEDVLADPATHIATTVNVNRQEVQPTRIGSIFTGDGTGGNSGLAIAVLRRGHFELNAGAVVRGAHLSPALQPAYLIPHTSVACGPSVVFDRRAIVGAACTVHF